MIVLRSRYIQRIFSTYNGFCNYNIINHSFGTTSEEITRQNDLFTLEKKRQRDTIGRIEKIEVTVLGQAEPTALIMNKHVSTPHDCVKHLSEVVVNRTVVASLNGEALWHMHKPLPDSCTMELLHFNIQQPAQVNKAFWRSCSFLLGSLVSSAFKDNVNVQLHSFPSPNVKSGSFVYDVQLSLADWKPTEKELKTLSLEMIKLCQGNHTIESLDVNSDLALDIFQKNPHKTKQIPDIAAQNDGKITIFKVGQHLDISRGPMIPNTSHMGRISVTNILKLETDAEDGPIYRFQGVALPKCILLNHFAYSLLEDRARNLNPARIPGSNTFASEDITPIQAAA